MSTSHSGFDPSGAGRPSGRGSDIDLPGPAGRGWKPPDDRGVPSPPPSLQTVLASHALVGVARDVHLDVEHSYEEQRPVKVLSFRIERYDEGGNRVTPVQVQMRGRVLDGRVTDGDWIAVATVPNPGETLLVDAVENVTTQTSVRMRGTRPPRWLVVIFLLVLAGVLAILGVVIYNLVNPPDPPFDVPSEGAGMWLLGRWPT
jgi:hypothetical protein